MLLLSGDGLGNQVLDVRIADFSLQALEPLNDLLVIFELDLQERIVVLGATQAREQFIDRRFIGRFAEGRERNTFLRSQIRDLLLGGRMIGHQCPGQALSLLVGGFALSSRSALNLQLVDVMEIIQSLRIADRLNIDQGGSSGRTA